MASGVLIFAEQKAAGKYLLVALVIATITCVIGSVLLVLYLDLPCDGSLLGKGYFTGYCQTNRYGDYEHGAIAFDLEPKFVDGARRADVLFLGESKMQTAASTEAVADYFSKKGLRFYAFGFGFGETAPFPLTMLERIGAHPMAVIINADGFFSDTMSEVATAAIGGTAASRFSSFMDYLYKYYFQAAQMRICGIYAGLCHYARPPRSWFRSFADGHWIWINGNPDAVTRQITATRDQQNDAAGLARQRDVAARQLARLKLDPACIILTGVPNPVTQAEATAQSLATALGLPLAQPVMDGLAIRDDAHLNRVSADRWSAALMQAIDPLIDRCQATKLH